MADPLFRFWIIDLYLHLFDTALIPDMSYQYLYLKVVTPFL
jgi:hypothetical protein